MASRYPSGGAGCNLVGGRFSGLFGGCHGGGMTRPAAAPIISPPHSRSSRIPRLRGMTAPMIDRRSPSAGVLHYLPLVGVPVAVLTAVLFAGADLQAPP